MMISHMIQELSHWQTHRHTARNRHYWKQYHLQTLLLHAWWRHCNVKNSTWECTEMSTVLSSITSSQLRIWHWCPAFKSTAAAISASL